MIDFLSMDPSWEWLAWTLLHFLWQGLLVLVLLEMVVRGFSITHPPARYVIHLGGLVLLAACPVMTFLLLTAHQPETVAPVELHPKEVHEEPPAVPQPVPSPIVPISETPPVTSTAATEPRPLQGITRPAEPYEVAGWVPYLVLGWLIGVVLLSCRLLLGFLSLSRILRHTEPLAETWLTKLRELSTRLGLKQIPRVRWKRGISDAFAAGLFRPIVLLPFGWVTQLSPGELEAILAHEFSHIRRGDLWVNLLQRILETLLFYHPAVWWISGRIREERELCCDRLAVQATGQKEVYARTLEFLAKERLSDRRPALAAGLGGNRMAMLDRVRCVLGLKRTERRSRWMLLSILLLVVGVVSWFGFSPQFLAADSGTLLLRSSAWLGVYDDPRGDDEKPKDQDPPRDKEGVQGDEERPRDKEGPRDKDRPRDPERSLEKDRPRDKEHAPEKDQPRGDDDRPRDKEAPREKDRPRDQERSPEKDRPRGEDERPREKDQPRRDEERPRDKDRPRDKEGPREVERPRDPNRERPRFDNPDPNRERPLEFHPEHRPLPPEQQEMLDLIRELRREVELLRNEVRELKGQEPLKPQRRKPEPGTRFVPPGPEDRLPERTIRVYPLEELQIPSRDFKRIEVKPFPQQNNPLTIDEYEMLKQRVREFEEKFRKEERKLDLERQDQELLKIKEQEQRALELYEQERRIPELRVKEFPKEREE